MKLKDIKHIHFTGIKGVGLTALALLAQDAGISVSGSDTAETFVTDGILKKRGIKWQVGFSPSHLPVYPELSRRAKSLLIYTGAHGGPHNPEVIAAQKRHVPTLSYAQAIPLFTDQKQLIAFCGVGGKSTMAAMLATILEKTHRQPSYLVGVGNIPALGSPAAYRPKSHHFVVETDEYVAAPGADDTPKFFYLKPQFIGVSNIEYDHPDVYANFAATQNAYLKFFSSLPQNGKLAAFADNPTTVVVAKKAKTQLLTYGAHPQADVRLTRYHVAQGKVLCTFAYQHTTHQFSLRVPGKFNAFNALCAIALSAELGVSLQEATAAIKSFTGTSRRFQIIGTTQNGSTVVDDYAHHPTEIKATLKAAREWFPGKSIIAIFQPHTYSRTKALLQEFAQSFTDATQVVLLPIYASARELPDPEISSDILAAATRLHHLQVHSLSDASAVIQFLEENANKDSLIITLGAGDIFSLAHQIPHAL